jgi:hypothetical protein
MTRFMMEKLFFLLTLYIFSSATSAGVAVINTYNFSGEWPLTVSAGKLECEKVSGSPDAQLVTLTTGGTTYAVNGMARGYAEKRGWVAIDEIWKADPEFPKLKVTIGPLIDKGLDLCK